MNLKKSGESKRIVEKILQFYLKKPLESEEVLERNGDYVHYLRQYTKVSLLFFQILI